MQETHLRADRPGSEHGIHASYFFDFFDEAFLQEAYARLLKRDPDPSGKTYYLDLIRKGESRYRILDDLAQSAEAKNAGTHLLGMSPYRRMKTVRSVPVLGRLVQAALFIWRIDAFLKDLRALENHIYRLSTKAGNF